MEINENELICHSWLLKKSSLSWKKQWFVLRRNHQLAVYKDETEHKPLKIVNLNSGDIGLSKIEKKEKDKTKYQFALFSSNNKTMHLRALNEYDFQNWFLNLDKILSHAESSLEGSGRDESSDSSLAVPTPVPVPVPAAASASVPAPGSVGAGDSAAAAAATVPSSVVPPVDSMLTPTPPGTAVTATTDVSSEAVSTHNAAATLTGSKGGSNAETTYISDDEFTSDNELPNDPKYVPDQQPPILEQDEYEDTQVFAEQATKNKSDLEKIKENLGQEYYLAQHYSYDSTELEHKIQKGFLLRLNSLNQWRKFFIVFTNKHLFFYKIRNYSDTSTIDWEKMLHEVAHAPALIQRDKLVPHDSIRVYPTKIIDLKNLVDVVELDPLSRTKQNCLLIITPTKRYRFCTKTERELVDWLIVFKSFLIVRKNIDSQN